MRRTIAALLIFAAALGFSYRSVRREKGIHLIISNLK